MKVDHQTTPDNGDSQRRPEKFPRPEIGLEKSTEDWLEFRVTWKQYKEEYILPGAQLVCQLYAYCSEKMKTSLSTMTAGEQLKKTREELLKPHEEASRTISESMVHIQQFLKQTQNQEEGVRSFLTRHRRVAAHCEFRERC